jgi:hypothetical protein
MCDQRFPLRLLVLLVLGAWTHSAAADGGTLRLSQTRDGYHIAVFTSPTPLRAGTVDVSVFLQDAKSGQPVLDVPIQVTAFPMGRPEQAVNGLATSELATNKLFRSAYLELPEAGVWHIDVQILRDEQPIEVGFDVELAGPPPPWLDLVLWLSWPLVVILLYVIHVMRVRGRSRRRPAT